MAVDRSFLSGASLARSDLAAFSFQLRSRGMSAADASRVFAILLAEFGAWRCAFLATSIARNIGREHLVAFHWGDDGALIHAAVATTPQHPGEPRGDAVDILGRRRLRDLHDDILGFAGRRGVEVRIGDLIEEADLPRSEARILLDLARHLPWLRPFVGGEAPLGSTLWQAISAALAIRTPPQTPLGDLQGR